METASLVDPNDSNLTWPVTIKIYIFVWELPLKSLYVSEIQIGWTYLVIRLEPPGISENLSSKVCDLERLTHVLEELPVPTEAWHRVDRGATELAG